MEEKVSATKLHSPSAVTLATLIGMPVAGTLLLAQNYRSLGNPNAARHCIIWGISTTVILIGIGFFLNIPQLILPICYTIGMHQIAVNSQGRIFRSHIEAGGTKKSMWIAVGLGFLCMFVALGAIYIVALIAPN